MNRQKEHEMLERVRSLILSCARRGQKRVVVKVSDSAGKFLSSYFSNHGYLVEMKNNQLTIIIPDQYFKKEIKEPLSKISKNIMIATGLFFLMVPAYFVLNHVFASQFSEEILLPIFLISIIILLKKFCK